nr:MAG TPA: collagen alpha 1(VIII) chain protein [Caudoviricetes sp.]
MARILIGNIKGPQGDRGQQGERGPQGAQGVPGTTPALVNNALATQSGVAALDAVMGKTLMDKLNAISRQMSRYNVEGIGIISRI